MVDEGLLQRARQIRLLALDVDGVLTDGRLYYDQSGNEMKAFSTRDGLGIKALQRCGITVALITGRSSHIVSRRAEELGIEHVYQGSRDKLSDLDQVLQATGADLQQTCYVGDDWVDLPVLQCVGLAVSVADADPLVRERVHWVTQEPGGRGAVRSVCNLLLRAQGHDLALLKRLGVQ